MAAMTYKEIQDYLDKGLECMSEEKFSEALDALKAASRSNTNICSGEAFFLLAELYSSGNLGSPDYEEALRCYQEAARRGNNIAVLRLAEINEGLDPAVIDELTEEAEQLGSAAFLLGSMYENGDLLEKDEAKALKYYRLGAEKCDAEAGSRMGDIYNDGLLGVERDEKKAFSCYKAAAEGGNATAMFMVGRYIQNGMAGLKASEDEAMEWYKKAYNAGEPKAENICRFLINQKKARQEAERAALEQKKREEEEKRKAEEAKRKAAQEEIARQTAAELARRKALEEKKAKEEAEAARRAQEAAQKAAATPAKNSQANDTVTGVIGFVAWVILTILLTSLTGKFILSVILGFFGGCLIAAGITSLLEK